MRLSYVIVVVIGTTCQLALAQAPAKSDSSQPPDHGIARLHLMPMPRQVPTSLKELCDRSSLIVEGVVTTTLPARQTSPGSLETDAVVSVIRTLKGPAELGQVVVARVGGALGKLIVIPTEYSLLKQGDNYIFFLTEDTRVTVPTINGFQRYLVTGLWSGLFYVEAGHMRVNAEERDRLRKSYEGLTKEQIINDMLTALRQ